jgi:hypothetical protein
MGRVLPALDYRPRPRPRLLLWLSAVLVALSVVAMHQLSSNHTAAQPTAAVVVASVNESVGHLGDAVAADHAHWLLAEITGHPSTEEGACPNCGAHSAMALTCLAALILLAAGWLLRGPVEWRRLRLPRIALPPSHLYCRSWRPPPLTLAELSVSRT